MKIGGQMSYSPDLVDDYLCWLKHQIRKDATLKCFFREKRLPYSHAAAVNFSKLVENITGCSIYETRKEYYLIWKRKEEFIAAHGETNYSNYRWFSPECICRSMEQRILGAVHCYY